jgi:hypothetical protein
LVCSIEFDCEFNLSQKKIYFQKNYIFDFFGSTCLPQCLPDPLPKGPEVWRWSLNLRKGTHFTNVFEWCRKILYFFQNIKTVKMTVFGCSRDTTFSAVLVLRHVSHTSCVPVQ